VPVDVDSYELVIALGEIDNALNNTNVYK